jgi:hypothetical protein
MERSNPTGVVSEFQRPLASLYGLTSWYDDDQKESKRAIYWEVPPSSARCQRHVKDYTSNRRRNTIQGEFPCRAAAYLNRRFELTVSRTVAGETQWPDSSTASAFGE